MTIHFFPFWKRQIRDSCIDYNQKSCCTRKLIADGSNSRGVLFYSAFRRYCWTISSIDNNMVLRAGWLTVCVSFSSMLPSIVDSAWKNLKARLSHHWFQKLSTIYDLMSHLISLWQKKIALSNMMQVRTSLPLNWAHRGSRVLPDIVLYTWFIPPVILLLFKICQHN
jgi:hypothetical protein